MTSCQKQKPSQIAPDYVDSLSDLTRAEACKKTNLLEDILQRENIENLFQCTTWDKKFPTLFKVMTEIPPADWDYFLDPVNKEVFNDRELRDKLVSLMKELDQKGGLDDMGRVITSLSDSNFFGHVYEVMNCAQNPECSSEKKITEEDIWKFFTFFKMEEGDVLSFAKLLGGVSFSLQNGGADFKKSLGKELESEVFLRTRAEFFNEMFERLGDKDFDEELSFYISLFEGEEGHGWLPITLREKLDRDTFSYLVRYPADVHGSLWKDFRVLNKTLDISLGCSGINPIQVDVSTHIKTFLDSLFNGNQEKFFRNSLQSVTILKTAQEICPNLTGYQTTINSFRGEERISHSVDFAALLEKTTTLMLKGEYYEFVKNLHYSGAGAQGDPRFLVRYLSSDLFSSFIEMVRSLERGRPNLVGGTYDLLKNYPEAGYSSMVTAMKWLKKKPFEERQSVSKVWSAFGSEGKMFFFNYLDSHYKEGTNLPLLFDFYNALLNIVEPQINTLLELFLAKNSKGVFLPSLQSISFFLGKKELLDDYRAFFSREHLLEIIRIVSTRSVNEVAGSLLAKYQVTREGKLSPMSATPRLVATNVQKCLGRLTEPNRDFYSLLNYLPSECSPLVQEDPYFRFMVEAGEMGQVVMPGVGFDGTGFFSSELMGLATNALNRVSKRFTTENGEGLGNKLDQLEAWLKIDNRRVTTGKALSLLSELGKEDTDLLGSVTDFYSLDGEFKHFSKLIDTANVLLKNHEIYKQGSFDSVIDETKFQPNKKFVCENYHQKIGGKPCPGSKELKTVANRILELVLNKNDKNPKGLEQMLRMVSVGYGLPIPYEGENQSYKRVTLKESFSMFFNFTDRSLKTNNESLEYVQIPKADEEFFETPEWRVYKKQLQGAPEPSVRTLNTMERIEVVIRDVRFDENYLGAHYLNAVAKAADYNDMVQKKYKVLKTCIPLKFCGKFMNKAQHKFAKNSRDTFLSLLDVNDKEGWKYGDYMQALLTSLVSSSPDKSQVSSLIKKKIFGLNIDVPWLNKKKDLEKHNGKILGLVSMVGMFTNSARVLRDRVGDDRQVFEAFLENPRLKQIDDNLMRNLDLGVHLPSLEALLEKVQENGLLEKLLDYVAELDYEDQRLFENIIFKSLYTMSFVADPVFLQEQPLENQDRYKNLSLLDLMPLLNSVVDNHEIISEALNINKNFLIAVNHFLDVTNHLITLKSEESDKIILGLNEMFYFLKVNQERVGKVAEKITSTKENFSRIYGPLMEGKDLLGEISASKSSSELIDFIELLRTEGLNWTPMQNYLQVNATKIVCSSEFSTSCINNSKHRQFQRILDYLFSDESRRMLDVLDFYSGKENVKIKEFFNKVFPSIVN